MRTVLALLLLVNAIFFGWSRGWLDNISGLRASGDREPERMTRQNHPERVQLLSAQAATALQATACVELGPLDAVNAAPVQAALAQAGIASDAWSEQREVAASAWGVATLKISSHDWVVRKEATYTHMHIAYAPLPGYPAEQPSLLLTQFASRAEAEKALSAFSHRALKGLRVLPLGTAPGPLWLHFAHADALRQQQLHTLAGSVVNGAILRTCAVAASSPASDVPH